MREQLARALEPIKRRIQMIIGKCVLAAMDDSNGIQLADIEVFSGEARQKIERFQDYGLTSNPPDDSEGIVLFQGGSRDNGVIIKMDSRQFRLKNLEKGEVALYTDEGDYIHFKRDNKIEIKTKELKVEAETKVEVFSPEVTVEAESVEVTTGTADITATEKVTVTSPEVEVVAPTGVIITTPNATFSGLVTALSLAIGGGAVSADASGLVSTGQIKGSTVEDANGTMTEIRTVYNTHTHNETGTVTNAPNQSMT